VVPFERRVISLQAALLFVSLGSKLFGRRNDLGVPWAIGRYLEFVGMRDKAGATFHLKVNSDFIRREDCEKQAGEFWIVFPAFSSWECQG